MPLLEKTNEKEYQSLISGEIYKSQKLKGNEEFFNSDINKYQSFFEMKLPKYHFEIINNKGEYENEKN